MAKGTTRHHHYVSQFYLRQFANERGQLCVFDRTTKTHFSTNPLNVAAARDFNRVDIPGHSIDSLEKTYGEIETDFAEAIKRILAQNSIRDNEALEQALMFMSLLFVRNPRMREAMTDMVAQTSRITMELVLKSKQRWESQLKAMKRAGYSPDPNVSYDDMKKFHEEGQYTIAVDRHFHIAQELSLWEKTYQRLAIRHWCLVKSNSDPFTSSDYPLSVSSRRGVMSAGIGLAKTEVFMPLSPRCGLLGSFESIPSTFNADFFHVAELNARTISMLIRQVFSKDDSFHYKWGRPFAVEATY